MIGGQTVDVEQENKAISFDTLMYIHNNKTAALIECAMMIRSSPCRSFRERSIHDRTDCQQGRYCFSDRR